MTRPLRYITAVEAAEVLRIGPLQVMELCRSNKIQAAKPGRTWLITEAALQAYVEAGSNQAEAVA